MLPGVVPLEPYDALELEEARSDVRKAIHKPGHKMLNHGNEVCCRMCNR